MNTINQSIKVWDLPVRLFHWSLVICFAVSWASVELFDDAMQVHLYAGYVMLTLVLFRVVWGFSGSGTARFTQFVTGLRPTLAYATTLLKPRPSHYLGHNPLGGWAVITMLALLAFQALTGLFSYNDELLIGGPLVHWVGQDISSTISEIHGAAFNVLLTIVGLHIAAVLFYRFFKHNNLIVTMITGYKSLPNTVPSANLHFVSNWRALAILVVIATGVAALVIYS
ncbi:cytochrome b/b6 domain-containing protein [Sulfuriferula thiophila]|uniref:cytochrome b/b6 domain-containing protein n=1 Tax=Sulfuriferula thiophila TaxID=1781211 RepID=UPI000F60E6EA|nr:cytochrome b/b6 domain-containing protein [Sulfuriferula thiophila]